MATTPQGGLLDRWLTINNQGNDTSTGEGDGAGPTTDWGRLLNLDFDQMRRLGYMGNVPIQSSGDSSEYQAGNPMQEAQDWMRQSGYNYGINPTRDGGQWNAWLDPQGNEVEGTRREFKAPNDNAFWLAANLIPSIVGGPMLAQSLGRVGAGAVLGGMGGFSQNMDFKDALKGAALGGIAGYGMDKFAGAPDAMGDYMRTGAAEGSTIGNSYTGAGGQAGAVGANSIAAQMAIPSDFDPDSLFRNVSDPTKALQELDPMGQMPGEMPGMTGAPTAPYTGPSAFDDYIRTGASDASTVGGNGGYAGSITGDPEQLGLYDGLGSLPNAPMPYEQTVEVTAPRDTTNYSNEGRNYPTPESTQGPGGSPINSFVPPVAPAAPTVPDGADYSNEGRNYPTPESTQGPGGSPVNSSPPGISSQLFDLLKANPRLALSLLGSVGGKLFGGSEGPASPTGGISGLGQAGMTAQQAPAFSRQYVATPAGYRPGFDPQHKYFTGIGAVGMAPPAQPQMGIPQEPAPATRG